MKKLVVIIVLLISSCAEMDTTNSSLTQKQTQLLPVYCMNFVVDETFVFSDSLFESAEYKECKTIVLEKLEDKTKE